MIGTPYFYWRGIHLCDPLYAPFAIKSLISDTFSPTIEMVNFTQSIQYGNVLHVRFQDSVEIEVVNMTVYYGIDLNYGSTIKIKEFWRWHQILFQNLKGSTVYHYKFIATDPVGNSYTSSDNTFTTPSQTAYPSGTPQTIPGNKS